MEPVKNRIVVVEPKKDVRTEETFNEKETIKIHRLSCSEVKCVKSPIAG